MDELCICGVEGFHCAHWARPGDSMLVVWSCSEACESKIEALRDSEGGLSVNMVNAARQA